MLSKQQDHLVEWRSVLFGEMNRGCKANNLGWMLKECGITEAPKPLHAKMLIPTYPKLAVDGQQNSNLSV
jgi:hypothetical protein